METSSYHSDADVFVSRFWNAPFFQSRPCAKLKFEKKNVAEEGMIVFFLRWEKEQARGAEREGMRKKYERESECVYECFSAVGRSVGGANLPLCVRNSREVEISLFA